MIDMKTCSRHSLTAPNAVEFVEQLEISFTAGGNAKWHNHFRRQFASL